MDFNNITITTENKKAVVTINRPKQLNALNRETIEELNGAITKLSADDDIRVIILTGAGEKAFVAGADIKEFSNYSVNEGTELAANGQESLFDLIENCNLPVIAAVNGFALGGGLELAMAAHVRVASDNAKMGLPETSLGLIPGYGGTQRLANLVGKGRSLEMIATADKVKAERAYEMGLVNHVTSAEALMDKCHEIADKMIGNSSQAIQSAIKCVNAGTRSGINGFKVEIEEFGKRFGTEDFEEGVDAFLNKRKPNF